MFDHTHGAAQMSRRRVLQIGGAAGLAAFLGSCGLGESSSGGSSSGSTSLDFWLTPNSSPEAMKAFTTEMATGIKESSGGEISAASLVIPWENALTKYTAGFSGNNPPDVTYQIIPWMNKWRETGVLADFREFASDEDLEYYTSGQPQSYLDAATGENGELLAVPFTQGFQPLGLNAAIWEKAGQPPLPTTFEEMIGFAEALTFDTSGRNLKDPGFDAENVEHWGMAWSSIPTQEDNWVWQYFWGYGSDYINEAGDDIGFDTAEGREALEVMKRLVDSGATVPQGTFADDARWSQSTISGKSGMQWMPPPSEEVFKQYPDARLTVVPLPGGPAGRNIVAGCGYWAIAAESENPEAAYEFARFLLQPAQADRYIRMILGQPTRPVEGNFYEEPLADPRMNTFQNEATEYGQYARATLVLPYQPQEFLIGKINDYLFNGQPLDAMITDASAGIRQMAGAA
ncbi:ABC transporter substrate-binding protein [Jiangella endophytica]|uniref:ABC transporter substrate-binding protein n=1 Tax=Jiangella endophytica TaxID=1623398 RepID=UPI0018E55F48|nr:extracellular solute-binding protein [Jiangella endophytica]